MESINIPIISTPRTTSSHITTPPSTSIRTTITQCWTPAILTDSVSLDGICGEKVLSSADFELTGRSLSESYLSSLSSTLVSGSKTPYNGLKLQKASKSSRMTKRTRNGMCDLASKSLSFCVGLSKVPYVTASPKQKRKTQRPSSTAVVFWPAHCKGVFLLQSLSRSRCKLRTGFSAATQAVRTLKPDREAQYHLSQV